MDITPDHVKEEIDMDSLPDDQSPAQDFFNVAAGQEYGLQALTQNFLKEESVEEQRSEIDLSTQVFIKEETAETKFPEQVIIKEGTHTKHLLNLTSPITKCLLCKTPHTTKLVHNKTLSPK
jgi:hypothetical protein